MGTIFRCGVIRHLVNGRAYDTVSAVASASTWEAVISDWRLRSISALSLVSLNAARE